MQLWQRNLYLLCLTQFIAMMAYTLVFPFLPLYVQTLGAKDAGDAAIWAGVIGASTAIAASLSLPIWGSLADRHGRKIMVSRALFANVFIVGSMGLVANTWQLLFLRTLMGCFGGFIPAATTLVSTSTPKERLGYSLGLMQMSAYAGSAIGPFIGGMLADNIGYRSVFFITGSTVLCMALLVTFLVREDFVKPKPTERAKPTGFIPNLSNIPALHSILIMAMVLFLIQFSTFIISPVLPLFVQSLEVSPGQVASSAGLVIAISGVTGAVAAALIGRISDAVGHKRVLAISTLGAGLFYLPQAFVGSVAQLLVLRGLIGVCVGGLLPTTNAIIGRLSPKERRASIYGLTYSAHYLGSAVGPVSGGLLAANFGQRSVFILTSSVFICVSLLVGVVVREGIGYSKPLAPVLTGEPKQD